MLRNWASKHANRHLSCSVVLYTVFGFYFFKVFKWLRIYRVFALFSNLSQCLWSYWEVKKKKKRKKGAFDGLSANKWYSLHYGHYNHDSYLYPVEKILKSSHHCGFYFCRTHPTCKMSSVNSLKLLVWTEWVRPGKRWAWSCRVGEKV